MSELSGSLCLPVVGDLEPELAKHIDSYVEIIEISTGETLFIEGDEADFMFSVLAGKLNVYRKSDGKDVYVRDLGPGESGGITSIFLTKPR